MRKSWRFLVAGMCLLGNAMTLNPAGAMAYKLSIEVIPAEPGPDDVVVLKTHGAMPDGCWSFEASSVIQNNNTFEITEWVLHNTDMGFCPMVVIEYTSYDTIGQLRPGTYLANATEIEHFGAPVITGQASIEFSVSGCDCTGLGDCDGNLAINPVDVVYMVNHVFRGMPGPADIPTCAVRNGDWNCDGAINPVDVVEIVNFVYRPLAPPPCDPCLGGNLPDLLTSGDDIYVGNNREIIVSEPVWLGMRARNIGRDTAFLPWFEIYHGNPDAGGILIGAGPAADIPPGQNSDYYGELFVFDEPGNLEIFTVVDGPNLIVEINENNNRGQVTLEVIAPGSAPPAPERAPARAVVTLLPRR